MIDPEPGPAPATAARTGPGPPETFALAVALLFALAAALSDPVMLRGAWRFAGLAPVALGASLHLWAWRVFRRRGTTVRDDRRPRKLVTDGPSRWTRNPMYLAGILILGGLALCTGRATPLAVPLLYAWTARARIISGEERVLHDRFGGAYDRYRERVGRWL